jgi:hypothetical protein
MTRLRAVWTLARTAGHSGVGISAPYVYQNESKMLIGAVGDLTARAKF